MLHGGFTRPVSQQEQYQIVVSQMTSRIGETLSSWYHHVHQVLSVTADVCMYVCCVCVTAVSCCESSSANLVIVEQCSVLCMYVVCVSQLCRVVKVRQRILSLLNGAHSLHGEAVWSRRRLISWCRANLCTPLDDGLLCSQFILPMCYMCVIESTLPKRVFCCVVTSLRRLLIDV